MSGILCKVPRYCYILMISICAIVIKHIFENVYRDREEKIKNKQEKRRKFEKTLGDDGAITEYHISNCAL